MITVKTFVFNPFEENAYLLYDETKEAILIDCGCMTAAEEKMLSDFILHNNLQLKRLLCTHLHFDHVIGNTFICKKYGIKPEVHQKEADAIPSIKEQIKLFKTRFAVQETSPGKFIVGNESIRFGESELTSLLVPGHSPGSLAFYSRKDGFIMVGDTLFRGSIGRTDLWGGNFDLLIAVIRDKILSLPDETIIYPGHGPSTTVIHERINNPFLTNNY
ncbi:MAG: MBL fold metallo-hydrolase [Tannerella sp.]|jgi:glyoxylase-like metal-dependent hydrolase (beta-lactamase superfamily II)|nr:MBL fold metallo-hydrolase [Tannerella sp.]